MCRAEHFVHRVTFCAEGNESRSLSAQSVTLCTKCSARHRTGPRRSQAHQPQGTGPAPPGGPPTASPRPCWPRGSSPPGGPPRPFLSASKAGPGYGRRPRGVPTWPGCWRAWCLGDAATAGRALSAGTRVAVRRGAPTAPCWQAPAGTRIVDHTNRPGKQQDRQQTPGSCTFILEPWPDR